MKEVKVFERELVSAVKGRVKVRVMNADGPVRELPWQRNLILDGGLDKIAYMAWASTFQWCVSGTGTTPTKVDTGSTASQSGSIVTVQSGTLQFQPGHVGKLLYWPTPNVEARITQFIDAQHVQVAVSQSVSTDLVVMYNVDQTALVTPYSMSMRYQTGEGYCGTTFVGNTIKLLRTFDFYMELSSVLITEIGFKEGPAVTTLFSRIVLAEPLYLSPGQWLQVSYELTLRLEPQSSTPKTPTITGWPLGAASDTAGVEQIQLYGIAKVDVNGITTPVDYGLLANEPYAPGTRLLGPGYGYINRWTNGAGSPIKIYNTFAVNPFINPREMAGKYAASSSKNYLPPGLGNAQWPGNGTSATLGNAQVDCMQPFLLPPNYPGTGINDWNGVDPYTNFPNVVPYYGNTSWANWRTEISPDTITPAEITLTANGTNVSGFQWQKTAANGAVFTDIIGATGSVYQVQPSEVTGPTRFRAYTNADTSTVGYKDEVTLYAVDDTAIPATYAAGFTHTTPVVHKVAASTIDSLDVGVNGRAAITPIVFRNLVQLTYTSGVPTVGQYTVSTNAALLTVDPATGTIYFASTNAPWIEQFDSFAVVISINCESKSSIQNTITWNLVKNRNDYMWIKASTSAFRKGTGTVDVGGSSVFISENSTAHAAVGSAIDRSTPRNVEIPLVLEPYVAKAFTRVKKATFLTNMANGSNWRTIGIGGTDADTTVANRTNAAHFNSYAFIFNQAQTKLNTHELTCFFRYTWRRDFS